MPDPRASIVLGYEEVSAGIPRTSTGIYIAYPTSAVLKPIYPGYKTFVNAEHTKIGIARRSFVSREHQYVKAFQAEVVFFPILELPAAALRAFEMQLLRMLLCTYSRSGHAREWFHTSERQAIAERVWSTYANG